VWPLFVVVSFASALPVASGAATEPSEATSIDLSAIDLSSYEGRWNRVDDGQFDAARYSAIDHAIGGLSWIMRKMASGVLRKTTTPPPELQFAWDGEQLFQGLQGKDGNRTSPVELDGQLREGEDPRGVPFSWVWSVTETGLRVQWQQHQAFGDNEYRIDATDRGTLIVQHTINVTAISDVAPIVYLSRFSRDDAFDVIPPDDARPDESDMAQTQAGATGVDSID